MAWPSPARHYLSRARTTPNQPGPNPACESSRAGTAQPRHGLGQPEAGTPTLHPSQDTTNLKDPGIDLWARVCYRDPLVISLGFYIYIKSPSCYWRLQQ